MSTELALTVRCRNWEYEPGICGETCGVDVTAAQADSTEWINAVLDTPEWFVVLRSCPEHGRHADPYCSLQCFERFHARHAHDH